MVVSSSALHNLTRVFLPVGRSSTNGSLCLIDESSLSITNCNSLASIPTIQNNHSGNAIDVARGQHGIPDEGYCDPRNMKWPTLSISDCDSLEYGMLLI